LNEEKGLFREMPGQTFNISDIWVCEHFEFNWGVHHSWYLCQMDSLWPYAEAKNAPFTVYWQSIWVNL